ncbi:MAG: hypothetical protein WKG07_45770 [Hymenobacter sp.]
MGGIFTSAGTSYREISPTNSLHIVIDGDKVSAHVDSVSPLPPGRRDDPLRMGPGGRSPAGGVCRLGPPATASTAQRCCLHCQVEWFDDGHSDDDEVGHEQRTVRRGRGSGRRGTGRSNVVDARTGCPGDTGKIVAHKHIADERRLRASRLRRGRRPAGPCLGLDLLEHAGGQQLEQRHHLPLVVPARCPPPSRRRGRSRPSAASWC